MTSSRQIKSNPNPKLSLALGLTLLGIIVSLVALYEHVIYSNGLATGPSFCNISSRINCEAVNASQWSSFLGIPVASYGVFFYSALLGLIYLAQRNRLVKTEHGISVALFFAAVASILSVVLFCISEFLIGALCLLCLGLYAINFGLLGLLWWANARGERFAGMAKGVRLLFSFGGNVIKGDAAAIRGALALGIVLVFSVILPLVIYRVELARSSHSPQADLNDQYLSAWRNAPVVELKVDLSRGSAGDYVKGEIPAPIQIVEFADFECPGCRVAYSKLTDILAKYQGQYSLVFKNYPLDSECNPAIKGDFHKAACFTAHLTRCAGEQGRFWEAIEVAFTDPALESDDLSRDDMRSALFDSVSRSLSLDAEALKECVDSRRHQAKIQDDVREGDRLGLTSTPSFWINGRKLERPTPEAFELVFRDILAKAGSR